MKNTQGISITALVLVIGGVLIVGGAIYYYSNQPPIDKPNIYGSPLLEISEIPLAPSALPNKSAPQSSVSVSMQSLAFTPASITIKKGTTVTWTNRDSTPHQVTADADARLAGLSSKILSTGEAYSYTFTSVGSFGYHCSLHPSMTGHVTVTN